MPWAKRYCPDCKAQTTGGRCGPCARRHELTRGSRQQRGYDAQYERERKARGFVEATHCATCGEAFTAANPKTAGHVVAIRKGGRGGAIKPECRRCNFGWRKTGT
jgi:hypothetical protein